MAHLVRNAEITSDSWQLLDTKEAVAAALSSALQGTPDALVPLPLWLASREAFEAKPIRLGILLEPNDDPQDLVPDLPRIELIAVKFVRFTDGRGYSIARLLRGRYGYHGELRAVGDVLLDQLYYMKRVGFDAFALRDDQDPLAAKAALSAFTTGYQGSTDEPLPLFRRRQAQA